MKLLSKNEQELKAPKNKVKYNSKDSDDSDALSDSDGSDDNLDAGQMMKLIPKNFNKSKFLKGSTEKKKKDMPSEDKKEIKKKPKAELMPCMSSSKKERNKPTDLPIKKTFIPRSVVATLKHGG